MQDFVLNYRLFDIGMTSFIDDIITFMSDNENIKILIENADIPSEIIEDFYIIRRVGLRASDLCNFIDKLMEYLDDIRLYGDPNRSEWLNNEQLYDRNRVQSVISPLLVIIEKGYVPQRTKWKDGMVVVRSSLLDLRDYE